MGSAQQKRLLICPGLGFRKTVVILRHWARGQLKSVCFRLHGEEALGGQGGWPPGKAVEKGMDVRPRTQCWCGESHWMNGVEGGEVRARGRNVTRSEFLVSEEILCRGRCG